MIRGLLLAVALLLAGPAAGQDVHVSGCPISGCTLIGPLNTTSSYQINGLNALTIKIGPTNQQAIFLGPGAGLHATATGVTFGTIGAGVDSLLSITNSGGELVALGPYTGEFIVNGFGDTMVGEHVIGFDDPSYSTGVGNDVFRDTLSGGRQTAVGAQTQDDGVGNANTSMGAFALHGNAGAVTFSATYTPSTGDVINIPLSTASANTTGLPFTVTYTVQVGDTISNVLTGLQASLNGSGVIYYPDIVGPGSYAPTPIAAVIPPISGAPAILVMHWPGSSTNGAAVVIGTVTCAGTCTSFSASVSAAFSGTDNIATGVDSLYAAALTTGSFNQADGDLACANLAGSSGDNMCYGYKSLTSATTGVLRATVFGFQSGSAFSAPTDTAVFGANWTQSTLGTQDTIVGNNNGCTIGASQAELLLVGYGACPPNTSNNAVMSIMNFIYGLGLNYGAGGSGPGLIGIGTTAPNATLTIGAAKSNDGHIGVLKNTAPALSSCGGGSPAVDSTASDVAGTVTEGTTATGCTVTFFKSYQTAPHCIVTSPGGFALTSYSTSTTALTLVNASASGNTYTYMCMQ